MSTVKTVGKTQKLAESALMIALAVALNEASRLIPWPFLQGGSVTVFSQVPIILISYRHGLKQGLLTSFVYSLLEMMFGFVYFGYVKGIPSYIILALFDYILAYGVLGLGGMLRGKIKNRQPLELAVGGAIVSILRYACHIVSGVTIWKEYAAQAQQGLWFYSVTYNGGYMIPETVITVVGLLAVGSVLNLRKKNVGTK